MTWLERGPLRNHQSRAVSNAKRESLEALRTRSPAVAIFDVRRSSTYLKKRLRRPRLRQRETPMDGGNRAGLFPQGSKYAGRQ